MAALYAATYPERTRGLVLFMPAARHENADQLLADLPQLREGWGAQEYSDRMLAGSCPTLYASEADRRWFANWLRVGTSPAVAYALNRRLGDRGWRDLLDRHHALVRRELVRFRGQERDTAGDGFFATFDGPARAIRCAQVVVEGVRDLGLEIRAGVHTSECEVHDGKVAGIAVAIGARVAAQAQPGEVFVSGTVKDLVSGSGLRFDERGEHELKGVPGTWRLYAVVDG